MNSNNPVPPFLQGGGEMGALIRSVDWTATPIGPAESWPHSLKIAVGIMLSSPFPMYIAWGSEYTQLYNDGYRPILGSTKHPQAMGISTASSFPEIYNIIGPMFDGVMLGNPVWAPGYMYVLERNGFPEECFFDFSYSPIRDENGVIGGVLVTVVETTEKVLALKKARETEKALELANADTKRQRDNLKGFFMEAPAGICILAGPELAFELVNPLYQQLFPGRNLLGKPLLDAVPEVKGAPIWNILQDVYQTGRTFEGNELLIPLARTDGGPIEDRYFNFIYQARKEPNGQISGIMVFVIEVTDCVVTKIQIQENAERFRTQMNAIPQIAWTSTVKGEGDFYNQSWYDYTGLDFEQAKAWGWKEVIHPDDLAHNLTNYDQILSGIAGGEFEVRVKRHDGEYRWHLIRVRPIKNDNEVIGKWIGTGTDIGK